MSAKSNLLIFMEKQGIKKPEFYKKTGLSNGFLDKNDNISSHNIEIIISIFPELSLEWLITGKGEMLRTQRDEQPECSGSATEIELLRSAIRDKDVRIEELKERIDDLKENQQLLREKITFLEVKLARCEGMAAGAAAG